MSGVPLEVVEHPWPAPLDELWRRPDLGAAFMCGLPLAGFDPPPQIVAASVPRSARCGGRPVYFTEFVAARGSGFETLSDCRGRAIALTTAGSHSGYNAVRYHLATRYAGAHLFAHAVGPCDTPRRALDAVIEGRADVAAVDSWAYALMSRHAPDLVAHLRVVESTVAAPIPPLVAAHGVDPKTVANLTDAFLNAGAAPELRDVLANLEIEGFVHVARDDYNVLPERRALADRTGVPDFL